MGEGEERAEESGSDFTRVYCTYRYALYKTSSRHSVWPEVSA